MSTCFKMPAMMRGHCDGIPQGSLGRTALQGHAHEVAVNAELRRQAEQIMARTQNIFVTHFPRLLLLSEK